MKNRMLVILALVFVTGWQAQAQNPAGMVLYFQSGDETYLLLAEDVRKTRGWAAFGGGAHEGETPAETAARETEEETRGYFSHADLLKKAKNQSPVVCENSYIFFCVDVDFVPAPRITNHQLSTDDRSYSERGPYAWIPYSELEPFLNEETDRKKKYPLDKKFLPAGSETDWVWPVWLVGLYEAKQKNALPWE